MDTEFIERKALLKDINESIVFSTRNGRSAEMRGAHKVVYRILEAPTVDVAEVKHGEWKQNPHCKRIYFCSECGRHIKDGTQMPQEFFPYCHCGAKMDGKPPKEG